MAVEERMAVSGTALSFLLHECASSTKSKEGFLLGSVIEQVKSHISDLQQYNSVTQVAINVTSIYPVPDIGLFYGPTGQIKEEVLSEILQDAAPNVVGWYIFRHNSSLTPTLRDRIISRELKNAFSCYDKRYFICCHISHQFSNNCSTLSCSYVFNKVNPNGQFVPLPNLINNLGQDKEGYRTCLKSDLNHPFNKVVKAAKINGINDVSKAIETAMSNVVSEALQYELETRTLTSEIDQMLILLAKHHTKKLVDSRNKQLLESITKEENQVKTALTNSLASPSLPREPFDFVNDLIKIDLKKINRIESADKIESVSSSSVSENKAKTSGHKRTHSEGTAQRTETIEKVSLGCNRDNAPIHSNSNNEA